MNGVRFEWERIESTFPESVTNNETRGYTRNEIDRILKFANPLESAVIHIASSSGMRRGGFDFTWECIRPVYLEKDSLVMEKYDDTRDSLCGMIVVYAGTNEQYFAMFTPEAWNAVKVYRMQWRSDTLRNPQPKESFLKRAGNNIAPLSCDAMANRLNKLLKKSKVREPLQAGKRTHEIPIMNGFRRFFNKINKETLSKDSPLAALIKKEMMMSHTGLLKLDTSYFQAHWRDLVEEYLLAVPELTINNIERKRLEKEKILKEKSQLELQRSDNEDLRRSFEQLKIEMHRKDHYYQSIADDLKNLKKKMK